jgi:hypothetical protein
VIRVDLNAAGEAAIFVLREPELRMTSSSQPISAPSRQDAGKEAYRIILSSLVSAIVMMAAVLCFVEV